MKNIVFIPAKSYSKRVPFKNTRKFCDSSLLEIAIRFFSEHTDYEIVVSSDSVKILDTALSYGCSVHYRPDEISYENTTNFDVIRHWIRSSNIIKTRIILAQPCHPIRYDYDLLIFDTMPSDLNYVSVIKAPGKYINRLDTQCPYDYSAQYKIDGTYYLLNTDLIMSGSKVSFRPFLLRESEKRIDIDYMHQFNFAEQIFSTEFSHVS